MESVGRVPTGSGTPASGTCAPSDTAPAPVQSSHPGGDNAQVQRAEQAQVESANQSAKTGPVQSVAGGRSPGLSSGESPSGPTRGRKKARARGRAAERAAQLALLVARDGAGSRAYHLAAKAQVAAACAADSAAAAGDAGGAHPLPAPKVRTATRVTFALAVPTVGLPATGHDHARAVKSRAKKMRSALAKEAAKEQARVATAAARHARNVRSRAKKRKAAQAKAVVAEDQAHRTRATPGLDTPTVLYRFSAASRAQPWPRPSALCLARSWSRRPR